MQAKDLLIYHCCIGQRAEGLTDLKPRPRGMKEVVQLIPELIRPRKGYGLMASSEQKEVAGHEELICEEGDDALDGLVIPPRVISKKEVVHELRMPASIDDIRQFLVISKRARADIDRPINLQQTWLSQRVLPHASTQAHKLLFSDFDPFDVGLNRMQLDTIQQILDIDGLLILAIPLFLTLPQLR